MGLTWFVLVLGRLSKSKVITVSVLIFEGIHLTGVLSVSCIQASGIEALLAVEYPSSSSKVTASKTGKLAPSTFTAMFTGGPSERAESVGKSAGDVDIGIV